MHMVSMFLFMSTRLQLLSKILARHLLLVLAYGRNPSARPESGSLACVILGVFAHQLSY